MHGKELQLQTETWLGHARDVAVGVPSVDYVGWHGEHFVVVRQSHHRHHQSHHRHSAAPDACDDGSSGAGDDDAACVPGAGVELKELPVRRRLDCGKGVDLGSEDAMWMERKDVPIDYERSGLES
jgi:hypothetical protein